MDRSDSMALQRGIVKLEEYTDNFRLEYEKEEKLLKELLGSRIIEIHHIGSTSIKGLKAKPIIDILIVINNFDSINEMIEDILKNYDYHNMGMHGLSDRYFFAKGSDSARTHYIHFVLPKCDTYCNQMYFKKYLINHPEYKEEYNKLKEELCIKYSNDRPKYTSGKDEFIRNVIHLAKIEYVDNLLIKARKVVR